MCSLYAPVRLCNACPTVQQREVQGRHLTLSRVFITSSCFRFSCLNCTFLQKSLYCDFILYYALNPQKVPELPLLCHPDSLAFRFSLSDVKLCHVALLPSKSSLPRHCSLCLLPSYTQHKPLTHSAHCLPPLP